MDEEQIEKIKSILLTPIISVKEIDGIILRDGIIYSSQKYVGVEDPDMSDFAIGFYNILYELEILDSNGNLQSDDFAGDTMNSFKLISKEMDDEDRIKWLNQYHCLANFWVLPKGVGRYKRGALGSKMSVAKDKMDVFLRYYKENLKRYEDSYIEYTEYTKKFGDKAFNAFVDMHFLDNCYCEENEVVTIGTKIKCLEDALENRAQQIARKKCKELKKYFSDLKLINL